MERCLWKSNDGHSRGIVREIRHGSVVVRRGEDVGGNWSRTNEARVITGGVGEWHGVAGREDSVADDSGEECDASLFLFDIYV